MERITREGYWYQGETPLSDILDVGSKKSIGYLALDIIRESGEDPETLMENASRQGFYTRIISPEDEIYKQKQYMSAALTRDVLMIADLQSLQLLLESNSTILVDANWPTNPKEFPDRLFLERAPRKTPLYSLIARAFGVEDTTTSQEI